LKRPPEGRRFTRTAAARNVSNVTIRVFGKGANRCAGSAAAGYVLVTQTFSQAHKQHHSSEPCYQYPEPPDKPPGGISRQLEATEPPAPRLPLFLEAQATKQAAYRDLRVAHVRGPPSQTGGTDSDIDVLCDTGFLPAPQLNLTTYSAPSRVSDPADWDEDLKIGGTLETGPQIVFAPRVKLRPPRVSFLVECGPIERGLDNSGLRSSTHSASRPAPSSSPPAASCSARRRAKNTPDNLETHRKTNLA
jgi:hypothetical protein